MENHYKVHEKARLSCVYLWKIKKSETAEITYCFEEDPVKSSISPIEKV
jgi:hypothetical protein